MGIKVYGKLQRGTTEPFEFGIYRVTGLNVKSVPQMVGDDDLTTGYNIYLRPDGGVQMRFGMSQYHSSPGAHGAVQGLARFYQTVRNGSEVSEVKRTVLMADGTMYNADTNTMIGTSGQLGGGNALPWTTVNCLDPNDSNYASGNTQVLVICTGYGGPYVYDGTNLYTPSGWSNAAGARWCTQVNGIVYFGGIDSNPYVIYGTGDGIIDSFESLPGYRVFTMTQPVTGLCAFGTGATAALVVGMNQGLSVIYGTGPNDYDVQDVPAIDGVMAGRTMVYEGGYIYFLGSQGVYVFDGFSQPVQISQKIEPWILNDSYIGGYPMTASDRQTSFGFIYKNRYHIGYASNSTLPNTILVFDLIVKGWTVLQTTPGINCTAPLNAPSDSDPFLVVAGSSSGTQVYNWDNEPDVTSTTITDDGSPVYAQFQTKFYKCGVPGTNKSLSRVYPEFFLCGTLVGNYIVQTDYGTTVLTSTIDNPVVVGGAEWDVGYWDKMYWAGGQGFAPFGPPESRIDFDGIQGESFSFGFTNTQAVAAWQWGGQTSVMQQQGRT